MDFDELVDAAIALVRRRRRVTEVDLRREYGLDDAALADLWEELRFSCPATIAERDGALVWTRPPATAAAVRAERRQLTVMFCRLADSAELAARLDPEELRELVVAHQRVCDGIIGAHQGAVAQRLEDGVLAFFGYPRAHEDDARRAVRAALRIVASMEEADAPPSRPRFAAGVGVHTGLVVVGQIEDSFGGDPFSALGPTPNVAARVQQCAAPGTVVVSDATARLVRDDFRLRPLGTRDLKGIDLPLELFAVDGEAEPRGRIHTTGAAAVTPFVGRRAELAQLARYWDDARAGRGQAVLLCGEAGIGKSRLVEQLGEEIGSSGGRMTFRCSPYDSTSALFPVAAWLRGQLRLSAETTVSELRRRLERRLRDDGLPADELGEVLGALLAPWSPAAKTLPANPFTHEQRRSTIVAVCQWLEAAARDHPILLVNEDLHWADPSTLELVDYWLERCTGARVLAVFTFRPEFRPPWPEREHVHALTLGRLGRRELRAMVAGVVGGKSLPAPVLSLVTAKTDGVPLYVEELVRMLLESDFLVEGDRSFELTGPLPEPAIPATLRDSLMARLDRRAAVRRVAQLASVVGREFSSDMLRELSELDDGTLRSAIDGLVEAGLLVRRTDRPDVDYAFKHALVRDVAYSSLLRRERSRIHGRCAALIEQRRADIVAVRPEIVAHHYGEAGTAERAFDLWLRAARQATGGAAYQEALSHLDRAWELRDALPPGKDTAHRALELHSLRGAALLLGWGHGDPEVARTYERALESCRAAGDEARTFPILLGLHLAAMAGGDLNAAKRLAHRLATIAERDGDPGRQMQACRALSNSLVWGGDPAAALSHVERALALYDPATDTAVMPDYHHDPSVACHCNGAIALWTLGRPASALVEVHAALARAQELGHDASAALALNSVAFIHTLRGDWTETLATSARMGELADAHGLALWRALGTTWSGRARIGLGDVDGGRELLRQGLETCRRARMTLAEPFRHGLLAERCGDDGRVDEALELVEKGFAAVQSSGERWYEAELHRHRGELLLLRRPVDEAAAEAAYHRALDVAAAQRARSWALTAATSLARLELRRGAHERARSRLEEALAAMPEDDGSEPCRSAHHQLVALGGEAKR